MRERLFHHPFLYRYAKSFYIITNASDDLGFLQDIAHDAIHTNKVRVRRVRVRCVRCVRCVSD
jgi:hypothetical protein